MRKIECCVVALGLAVTGLAAAPPPAHAQSPLVDYEGSAKGAKVAEAAQWRLAFRPPVSVMAQSVAQLRTTPGLTPATLADADRLVAQSSHEPEAEARRSLWRAATILLGRPWSPGQDLVGAIALRTTSPIATSRHADVRLDALYPLPAAEGRFSLDLFRSEPTTSATPVLGAEVKRLAEGDLTGPRRLTVDLGDAPDGAYLLVATIQAAGGASARLAQSLYLVRDLAARKSALEAKLAHIKGHEDAKWTADYPFVLARGLEDGTREIVSYDFPQAMARSEKIMADLATGRDDVWQARGLQDRAYAFSPTGELIPYQLYVPSTWTPARRSPLVVALHGANLDETNMLGRNGGEMQKLAEAHGFIVVAPLGYKLNSAYGSQRGLVSKIVTDQERVRRSEADVLQVMARVEAEYNVDPHRRYLTGNSMGGGGTWWIGGQHPDLWAAIAPAAYGGVLPQDVPALKTMPILAVVGDHDEIGMLPRVRQSVAVLEAGGAHPQLVVVPGGTHASAYERAMPQIFDFFSHHVK